MRFYDSVDEVERRLSNGVILYKGEPVRVMGPCMNKGSKKTRFGVTVHSLPTQERSWKVSLDDPELEYRQIRLGFVNSHNTTFRLIRRPQRTVQQSLNSDNVFVDALEPLNRGQYFFMDLMGEQSTCDSLAGKFPSMEEARKNVESGERRFSAFHYDWCYGMTLGVPVLWYRTKQVGLNIDPKKILKLEPELRYLKEAVEEIGLRVEDAR